MAKDQTPKPSSSGHSKPAKSATSRPAGDDSSFEKKGGYPSPTVAPGHMPKPPAGLQPLKKPASPKPDTDEK